MWLEAQCPPLVQRRGSRIVTHNVCGPMADPLRLQAAALCGYGGGEATLDSRSLRLLAECLLMPPDEVADHVVEFMRCSKEFLLVPGAPNRVIFKESEDPFINWIVESGKRRSTAA
jgi:hypothetical protein